MEIPVASVVTTCSVCGESLNSKGECLACLLRTVLDESIPKSAPPASLVFGDFEIVRREDGSLWELGRGAFGVTYLAVDNMLRRKVALKVIEVPAAARTSQTVRERFLREARAAAALRHPNVAAVHQFGASPDGSHCYYAMELVEGETLEARVRREGPLGAKVVLDIAIQITRALMAAAAHGLVHRDLKPGNIMLTRGDADTLELEVKVIDFGLAKALADAGGEMDLTHGEFVGTPNFASPEQFARGPVDVRSDIYSLGGTLWFALTGKTPFPGRDIEEIRSAQKSNVLPIEQLKAARVPAKLRSLLESMLAFEPAARPGIQGLAPQLQHCLPQAKRENIRRTRAALAAALIVILGVSAFFVFHSLQTGHRTVATGSNLVVPEKSIAVLPFENRSRDPDNAYLAEGIQDEILTRLSKIADLRVISRTSTQHYTSAPENLPEIARLLGVSHILEGGVQKSGDVVRVNVQLIKAANDSHLWADTFDRKLTDIFAVESDIATTIAQTLQAKLTSSERTAIAKHPTANTDAYDYYLKGRFFWNKRTGADLRTAIECFNQALGKDPSYALAYAGLADSYALLPRFGAASSADSLPQAKEAAKKALELDDTLAEAHNSLAFSLAYYDFDFEQAVKEFERAIQSNPNYATAHHWYGELLGQMGRFDEGIAESKRAQELDPLSLIINADLGEVYRWARQYNNAIEQLRKTIEMDPRFYYAHWNLGMAFQLKGELSDAIGEYRKAVDLNDDPLVVALLGQAYARAGQLEEAQEILGRLSNEAKSRYVPAYGFALMSLALGDKERAVDEMERAYRERNQVFSIQVDPMLDDLRGTPRFEAIVQKVFVPKR